VESEIFRLRNGVQSSRFRSPAAAGGGAEERRGGVRSAVGLAPPAPAGGGVDVRCGADGGSRSGPGRGEGIADRSAGDFELARPRR